MKRILGLSVLAMLSLSLNPATSFADSQQSVSNVQELHNVESMIQSSEFKSALKKMDSMPATAGHPVIVRLSGGGELVKEVTVNRSSNTAFKAYSSNQYASDTATVYYDEYDVTWCELQMTCQWVYNLNGGNNAYVVSAPALSTTGFAFYPFFKGSATTSETKIDPAVWVCDADQPITSAVGVVSFDQTINAHCYGDGSFSY